MYAGWGWNRPWSTRTSQPHGCGVWGAEGNNATLIVPVESSPKGGRVDIANTGPGGVGLLKLSVAGGS
jgi:hypothetical protein